MSTVTCPTKIRSMAVVSLYFALMHRKPFYQSHVIERTIYLFLNWMLGVGFWVKQKAANRRQAPRKCMTWRVSCGHTLDLYTDLPSDLKESLLLGGEGTGPPLQYSCLENPWTVKPGGLWSTGSLRVGHK